MLRSGAVTALGTMSGTSLDGVDAAVVVTDGEKIFEFGPTSYRPYCDAERGVLRAGLGKWPQDAVENIAQLVEEAHCDIMNGFHDIDIAGFHGQTLAHDPKGRGTHQCGDGKALASAIGVPVVWDFRSEDVKAGGEGAPLAPFYHFALAKWIRAVEPIAFLNLGGVGNLTWIDPSFERPDDEGALLAFDTGPANAPLNDLMRRRLGLDFDAEGALAASGGPDEGVLATFLTHAYFAKLPPKSLDRDAFGDLSASVERLSDADAAATLTAAAAFGVVKAMDCCPTPPARLLVTGGGRKNPTLMAMISRDLACEVVPVEAVGLDGDMLEAQAFGYLAVRVARGLATSCSGTTGAEGAVSGGILSYP